MDANIPVSWTTVRNDYQRTDIEGVTVQGQCEGSGVAVRRKEIVVTRNDGIQTRTPVNESGYQCVAQNSLRNLQRR